RRVEDRRRRSADRRGRQGRTGRDREALQRPELRALRTARPLQGDTQEVGWPGAPARECAGPESRRASRGEESAYFARAGAGASINALSQCSSALPSTKRQVSNQVV